MVRFILRSRYGKTQYLHGFIDSVQMVVKCLEVYQNLLNPLNAAQASDVFEMEWCCAEYWRVFVLFILQSKMLCLEYVQNANSVFDSIVR